MHPRRRTSCAWLAAVGILVGICALAGVLMAWPYLPAAYSLASTGLRGTQVIRSSVSPDGAYEAYAVEAPSVDPPNQSLYIQTRDEINFVFVGQLVEDVDSIQDIQWSPGSDVVVFVTRNNLIAALVPGFTVLMIPLASPLTHYQPGKFTTFGGGIPQYKVAELSFPEAGTFAYRLVSTKQGSQVAPEIQKTVRLGEVVKE
jgi:hypothetical protein